MKAKCDSLDCGEEERDRERDIYIYILRITIQYDDVG